MEPKKYQYNSGQTWFITLLCAAITIFFFYTVFNDKTGGHIWLLFAALGFIMAGLTAYLCKTYFIPLVKEDIALEMDEIKLEYFITNKIIYWKDVQDITYKDIYSGGRAIYFAMKDGSKIRISTRYVECDDVVTYDIIRTFFLNCK